MSKQTIQPYLFFGGRCEEALEFYKEALGAQMGMLMRFSENPDQNQTRHLAAGFEKKVMHAEFQVGEAKILVSDGCDGKSNFDGFRLALSVTSEAEANRAFNGLAAGGKVDMPLSKTFWSPCYGMVTDKFGLGWMVMVSGKS